MPRKNYKIYQQIIKKGASNVTIFIFSVMTVLIVAMVIANATAQSKLKTKREEKKNRFKSLKAGADGKFPLMVRNSFLNYNEMPFFDTLRLNLSGGLVICPKVHLQNVLSISKDGQWKESDLDKLSDKKLDFLLCDSSTMKPLVGIMLGLSAVSEEESFTEKACRDAGLEFVRFPSKERYLGDEVTLVLKEYLDRAKGKSTSGVFDR